jgi:hypothetical protein
MFARIAPASKTGQLTAGPTDQNRLRASAKWRMFRAETPGGPRPVYFPDMPASAFSIKASTCRSRSGENPE